LSRSCTCRCAAISSRAQQLHRDQLVEHRPQLSLRLFAIAGVDSSGRPVTPTSG